MPCRKMDEQLKNGARLNIIVVSSDANDGKICSVTCQADTQGR